MATSVLAALNSGGLTEPIGAAAIRSNAGDWSGGYVVRRVRHRRRRRLGIRDPRGWSPATRRPPELSRQRTRREPSASASHGGCGRRRFAAARGCARPTSGSWCSPSSSWSCGGAILAILRVPADSLMGVSAPLLSAAGVIAAVIAMMVDGRRAVAIAVVVLAAGLAPTAATFGGAPGVAVLGACAVAAVACWPGQGGWADGSSPGSPGSTRPSPRSRPPTGSSGRAAAGRSARRSRFPIASWVSFNVPDRPGRPWSRGCSSRSPTPGRAASSGWSWLEPSRISRVGVAMVGIATGTAWLLRSGSELDPRCGARLCRRAARGASSPGG